MIFSWFLIHKTYLTNKLQIYEKVDFKKYFWHSVLVSIFLLSSSWMIQINLVKICKTLWRFSFLCLIHGTQNQTKIYLESSLELQLWCVSRFPIQPIWIQSRTLLTYYSKYILPICELSTDQVDKIPWNFTLSLFQKSNFFILQ